MRHRLPGERRCSYVVLLEDASGSLDQLRELAAYLSDIAISDFDVVIVDASLPPALEEHRRVLRWVGRHIIARPKHRMPSGAIDPIRAAVDVAACDRVIVADPHVRYNRQSLEAICALLELHEVVEPQDYFDPLPWWGGIEAGRLLVHRGVGPLPDHGSTFGFRKNAVRAVRGIDSAVDAGDNVRRLASQGAEVFWAVEIFVRRIPPPLTDWLRDRPLLADDDLGVPMKAAFFFALIPLACVLALVGGARLAGDFAGAIAFGSVVLAVRGRIGAGSFFPWRACFYAPVWLLERSVSIYWALLRKLSDACQPRRLPVNAGATVTARAKCSEAQEIPSGHR